MKGLCLPLWTLVLAVIGVRGEDPTCSPENHCYQSTERRVVTSPGFPGPYPPGSRGTWQWRQGTGRWGVVFSHYNVTTLGCKDYVTINDSHRVQVYCVDNTPPDFYSSTPTLTIEFVSSNNSKPGSFKLTILYGGDVDELRKNIYYEKHEKKNKAEDVQTHVLRNAIIAIGGILAVIFVLAIVIGLLLYRKHVLERRRDHMTSLGIRRGSGRLYSRKSSSNTEDTPPQPSHAPPERTCTIIMGNSARPWTLRAVMTSAPAPGACADQSTLPKSVDVEASHAHSGHAHSGSHAHSGHAHSGSHAHSDGHAHGQTSTSGATPMADSVTIHVSARVGDQGEGHSYTPLPTRDSDGEWLDEKRPILED